MGSYYGCGMAKQVPLWSFDLSSLDTTISINSIHLNGDIVGDHDWSGVYLSMSTMTGSISTNTWHHVVVVYNGSTATFYLDGSNIGSQSWTTGTINSTDIALGVQSRNRGNVREHYFKGKMDEIALWEDVLTAAEVTALYNLGAGLDAASNSGNYISAGDLEAYWSFTNSNRSNDQTSNNNDLIHFSSCFKKIDFKSIIFYLFQ